MGPGEVSLMIMAIRINSGEKRINANRLPAISIDLFTMRAPRLGSALQSRSAYRVESVGPFPSRWFEWGNTWNESRISLICSMLSDVQSAFVTLVRRPLVTDFPSAVPISVKMTPKIAPSSYHPFMSVSLVELVIAHKTFSNCSRLFPPLRSKRESSNIKTKGRWDRSVRLRSRRSILTNSSWSSIPKPNDPLNGCVMSGSIWTFVLGGATFDIYLNPRELIARGVGNQRRPRHQPVRVPAQRPGPVPLDLDRD